ncbi:c-type cytochrome [soil metagenome]
MPPIRKLLLAPLLFLIPFSLVLGLPTDDPDDLASELPRIPPVEPEDAPGTFQIQEGFRLVPVAVEPLVTDPVDACYDADGRLYVVEMRGYPYPEQVPTGRIRRLEDLDGDGRLDRSTVFLEPLSWPTAVVPYEGGVFLAVAPDILYAKDTTGDGVADVRKVMFSGFGTSNVQSLLNGLLWGPDGWIYGVSGNNGGEIVNHSRPDQPRIPLGQRDFRFKPDGSAFEPVSGGGQFGHSFDDWGRRFTCNNSNHIRQIVIPEHYRARNPHYSSPSPIVDIPVEGAAGPVYRISPAEPWRIVRTRQRVADPKVRDRLPETERHAIGFFTSATGITIYRGTAYPEPYRNNVFIGDVGGNLIHRKSLEPNGSIFKATRADLNVEFLASTDNWFRPVNFRNTPDGTLLVLDMYRETIEHPCAIPEPIKQHLDLLSGHDRGRLYQLVHEDSIPRLQPALRSSSTEDLVALLADPDAWWRETAQRLLIERDARDAIPGLRDLAMQRPSPLGRMHALWTLDVLGGLTPEDLLPALKDDEPGVREGAARLAETRVGDSSELRAALLALAVDPDPMVRLQAAFSIGEVEGPEAIAALAEIVASSGNDRYLRAAVLTSLANRSDALLATLLDRPEFLKRPEARSWLGELASLVGAAGEEEAIRAVLAKFAVPEADPTLAPAVVLGLGEGLRRSGGSLRAWAAGPGGEALVPLFEQAAEVASGEGSASSRAQAVRLVGLGPSDRALTVLPDLLDARHPGEVQLAALQTLGELRDGPVGPAIIASWPALSPSTRREAAEVLFARPDRLAALLDAVEKGNVPPGDLDPIRREQLRNHPDPALQARARTLLADASSGTDRVKVLAAYQNALDLEAKADHGREVFKQVCATCHKAEGVGEDVGPDLATITNRTPEDLLLHILDPNREVLPVYLNYTVATTDGRILTGQIVDESSNSITLKRAEGATDVVPRQQIEQVASTGLSLMPEGLEKDINPQAMADLIAYLLNLRAEVEPAGAP